MNNYVGKTVLITGGGGYIGSALLEKFCAVDCRIIVMCRHRDHRWDKLSRDMRAITKQNSLPVEIVYGDITKKKTWDDVITLEVDIIFHLASAEYEPDGNTRQDLNVNAVSVLHLLQTCVEKKCDPKIIFSSSTNIFGRVDKLVVDEGAGDEPLAEWSAHKLLAENYFKIYSGRFGVRTVTLRLPNVYGAVPRKDVINRMVLNKVIQYGIKNRRLILFNNRKCYRDFLYIEDIVVAFMRAGLMSDDDCDGRYFVIGSKRLITIADVWAIISDEIGKIPISINDSHILNPIDMRSFTGNYHKFNAATDWKPEISLETGIKLTVKELRRN